MKIVTLAAVFTMLIAPIYASQCGILRQLWANDGCDGCNGSWASVLCGTCEDLYYDMEQVSSYHFQVPLQDYISIVC